MHLELMKISSTEKGKVNHSENNRSIAKSDIFKWSVEWIEDKTNRQRQCGGKTRPRRRKKYPKKASIGRYAMIGWKEQVENDRKDHRGDCGGKEEAM